MLSGSERPATGPAGGSFDEQVTYARVLVEIGDFDEAQAEVARVLQHRAEDVEALSLLAKIKHMRGSLSEAFAYWARGHALHPETGAAQARLTVMLQLARDPERGAGEFLAVGQDHLWRKPAAMLELEEAFRLFAARRPAEARNACALLARRYRGRDPDLYKLAVLAEAWIAELSGDPAEAAAVLEELGQERGFESDLDRALALVRVYEQLGGEEHWEKAVLVCEYLARTLRSFEQVTAMGRLAALTAALGRAEEAAAYEGRFLEAFQERMHRVSLAETTAVAARRYLPLAKLETIRYRSREPPVEPVPRQRALLAALNGDRERGERQFARLGQALDLQYRADLAQAAGNREDAMRLRLAALRRRPDDRRILSSLLQQADGAAGEEALREHFARPAVADRSLSVLEAAVREAPLRASRWQELAVLHRFRGDEAEARRCAERAAALRAARERQEHVVGRALTAAVYHFAGGAKGLIHEVWAERIPAPAGTGGNLEEVLGAMTPELEQAVRNTFVSVRQYADAKLPQQAARMRDANYRFKITKEDEPSRGLSGGLPFALAFLSVFLDRPLPQDLASSGVLVSDAHDVLTVRPVGEVEFKVRGAYNRNLRGLLLPGENRAALDASPLVPRAVCDELVLYVRDLDEAVSLVFGNEIWVG